MSAKRRWREGAKAALNGALAPLGLQVGRRRAAPDADYDASLRDALGGAADPLVVDVGAHHGGAIAPVLALAPSARVVAVEPAPDSFRILRERWEPRGVRCVNAAAGEAAGEMDFHLYGGDMTHSALPPEPGMPAGAAWLGPIRRTIRVPVRTLDDVLREHAPAGPVRLLKIDVQGFEDRVLRGAAETLGRTGAILIEVHFNRVYAGSCLVDDVCVALRARGFRLRRALGCLMSEDVQRPVSSDFFFIRE